MERLVTAVRIHRHQTSHEVDTGALAAFVESALAYSDAILIGVDASDDDLFDSVRTRFFDAFVLKPAHTKQDVPEKQPLPSLVGRVFIVPVEPYYKFTIALNVLLLSAFKLDYPYILYASVEMTVDKSEVERMLGVFDNKTLVVGKATAHHSFQSDKTALAGLTAPWNTFAMWSVHQLARTGFLMISDSNTPQGASAIEEVPTIALHQSLFPNTSNAYLVKTGTDGWNTDFSDPARAAWQKRKLESKQSSAQSHLAALNLSGGTVHHVQL